VPDQTRATNAQLTEIMLAQDFQDLTGQVIKKITDVVHKLESQLLKLLVDNASPEKMHVAGDMLNGPVVNGHLRDDVVTNQQQVDDLLESLGF
jgi:chemotaxis protein CheZ